MPSKKSAQMRASVYAHEMTHHSFGHACYHHTTSQEIQPGAVGYFDHRGEWSTILHLRDLQPSARQPARGIAAKFTRLKEDLERAPEKEMRWGPLTSRHVKRRGVSLTIEVPIPVQVPLNAGVDSGYEKSEEFGAVLVTHGPVTHSRIKGERIFEDWAKENEAELPKWRREVKDYGLWIVTNTYSAKKMSLNVWQDRSKTVKLSFAIGVEGLANLEPGIEFGEGSYNDGWLHYEAKARREKMVCFVGGIRFEYKTRIFTRDKLREGVSYVTDPRRWESYSWVEHERIGFSDERTKEENEESIAPGSQDEAVVNGRVVPEAQEHGSDEEMENEQNDAHNLGSKEEEISVSGTPSSTGGKAASEDTIAPEETEQIKEEDDEEDDEEDGEDEDEEYGSGLVGASAKGRINLVEQILKAGEDVNQVTWKGGTALQAASARGHEDIVELLIKEGADVNALGQYGQTALMSASKNGNDRIIQIQLNAGADPNISSHLNVNALHEAASSGHDRAVLWLLAGGANANRWGPSYETPLQAASSNGWGKCVRWLLAAGADMDEGEGTTHGSALFRAAYEGHLEVVEQLITAGADVNMESGHLHNPLQAASASGHYKVVEYLLQAGADLGARGGDMTNPISAASCCGHKRVVELLLEKMAKQQLKDFGPALAFAAGEGYNEIAGLLIEAGADVNGEEKSIPLVDAVGGGHEQLVQLLLGSGADVNATRSDIETVTALYIASEKGHKGVIKLLLDAGADVEAHAGYLGNALLIAACNGHAEVIQLLLAAGADIESRNPDRSDQGTALHWASGMGHIQVIEALFAGPHNADVNAPGGYYGNALQAAAVGGHKEVVVKLLELGADPHLHGGRYGSAPQAAAFKGQVDIVSLFIERGVMDIEAIRRAMKAGEEGRKEESWGSEGSDRYDQILGMLKEKATELGGEEADMQV